MTQHKPTASTAREPEKFSLMHYRLLISIPLLIICLFLLAAFTAHLIPSTSMEPTLHPGDHILTMRSWIAYPLGSSPSRGDIIVFHLRTDEKDRRVLTGNSDTLIKRVVGLPGETVRIVGSDIYINDRLLTEKYAITPDNPSFDFNFKYAYREPYTVPHDQYFVLGDNRTNSDDSRYWGCVYRHDLVGRFIRVLYHDNKFVPEN